ncbi:MAG TPA: Ig-like domain-containing protein [Gemmatimonadales bacterium]|nr:Ig-like domain-containing protein [Gemmatimonadales bacterium]
MSFKAFRTILPVGLLGLAAGCNEVSGPTEPTLLEISGGQNQTGQVGSPLPVKVIVLASNRRGPMAGVTITMKTEGQGGGSVTPRSAPTGTEGTAEFTWTLGPKVGSQTLTASTTGPSPLTTSLTAVAMAGPASVVLANSETFQLVVVGRAVPIRPSVIVTDAFGNPIAGVPVTFEAGQGASVLTGTAQTSDAQGGATLGGWTIGLGAVSHTVRGAISTGSAAVFETRGIPAGLAAFDGTGQTSNVGTAVPLAPGVRASRDDGSPLSGVPVDFTVTAGGGSVAGGAVLTGADGVARPIRWILGAAPGSNRLEAMTLGRSPVRFEATGVLGVATAALATGGTGLAGFFGNYVLGAPEVTVTDAEGRPVALVPVTFQVTEGGGLLTGSSTQTDFLGRASPTSWRFGGAGPQTVSATAGALPPVAFPAAGSAAPASTFKIEVRYTVGTNPTPEQRAAFDGAIARWTGFLVAGAPPYLVYEDAGCGNIIGETVDGVVIAVELRPIDGPNGILGAAGPCILRDEGYLPAQGYMQFDTADLALLQQASLLEPVILHEMGHVLGFGTIWNFNPGNGLPFNAFLLGRPGPDPTFNGPAARAAFFGSVAPGTSFTGTPIPVEGTPAGAGTAYSHWRESTFRNEVMTGFISTTGVNPLSAMTVQQFRDLGYMVNDAMAEAYTFQAFIQSFGQAATRLVEADLPGDMIVINRQGRMVGRVPRPAFK